MSGSSEIARIIDQLTRAFDGNAWHGPALFEILEDVDASTTAKRPIQNAHTIWELTLHVAGWDGVVVKRLRGNEATLECEDDFPVVADTGESAWKRALELLRHNHEELLNELSTMPDSRLTERVPGKDYDIYFMLHGAVQHALYHAGQIALLKKA
jgi:uncharacterized damage-inducible protein DinB